MNKSLLLAMKRIPRHRFAAKRNATSDPHNFAYSDAADMGGIGKGRQEQGQNDCRNKPGSNNK